MISRHVYVVGIYDNPVKIGVATNVERRVRTLQIGCPEPLVVHWQAVVPETSVYNVETAVHRELAQHHRRGEWFNVDVETAKETIKRVVPEIVDQDEIRIWDRARMESDIMAKLAVLDIADIATSESALWYRVLTQNDTKTARVVDAMIAREAGVTGLAALRTFVLERKPIRDVMGNNTAAIYRAEVAVIKALEALKRARTTINTRIFDGCLTTLKREQQRKLLAIAQN